MSNDDTFTRAIQKRLDDTVNTEIARMKEEKIELLRDRLNTLAQRKQDLENAQQSVDTYRHLVSGLMQELGLKEFAWAGLFAHFAKSSPSRRVDYELLQRSFPDLYTQLCTNDVITYTEPKEPMRLVVDVAKKAEN